MPNSVASSAVDPVAVAMPAIDDAASRDSFFDTPNERARSSDILWATSAESPMITFALFIDSTRSDAAFAAATIPEIADRLNYSYSHLSYIFSNEIGMSLQTYYNQKRIDTAERLLRETTMSINDIALKLRYQSIHSFSKAFKKVTGMAPSQYRMIG